MRKIIIICFTPVFIALVCLFYIKEYIDANIFSKDSTSNKIEYRHIDSFVDNKYYEAQFLNNNNKEENIFILGSSELTDATDAIPYNFISNHFQTKVKGVGHAGNQCFSIYSQLLANTNRLNNAPIVIILSPGWFHSSSAKGTSSTIFLEFNSPRFLNSILNNDSISNFRQYETERISNYFNELVNPDLSCKLLYFERQSSKSFLHKSLYSPLQAVDNTLNILKTGIFTKTSSIKHINRKLIEQEAVIINWDSLLTVSKKEQIAKSTNNKWYIDNDYYKKYINGNTTIVTPINNENNQELKDYKMLLKLLKEKNINASFIILPLNPYYYTNSNELNPLIEELKSSLIEYKYPFLNLWNSDTTTYDKGILKDVMHLSTYAWFKVDKFIVETYKLTK